MRMTKLEACQRRVNDEFSNRLDEAFSKKFPGVEIETQWDIFSMQLISTRADEQPMTPEQHAWITGFSEGYAEAMGNIKEQK